MSHDATNRVKEYFARVGERALARLQEIHPHLRGKSLEEAVEALKQEELRRIWGVRGNNRPSQTSNNVRMTDSFR
jgi:DNA-binding MurR/RpiR family transcriptional regulator